MADTTDTPHVGTDPVTRMDAPTGTMHYAPGPGTAYAKLRTPANPDYYHKATPGSREFVQRPTNNGLYLDNPSKTFFENGVDSGVKAVYNQATNHLAATRGYDPAARYPVDARASNYGMAPTEAAAYNEGIHVVGADKISESGPGKHTGGSHYALDALSAY